MKEGSEADAQGMFPEIKLKPFEEDRLLAGHLWVFSNEVEALPKDLEPGSVVRILDSRGRFHGVGFFNPSSLIALRVLSRQGETPDVSFFVERFKKALAYRRAVLPGEECFRLAYGESDGLPGLVVDRYGDYLCAQILSAGMEKLWPVIQEALVALFKPGGILLRNDNELRKLEGLPIEKKTVHGMVPERIEMREGDCRYLVNPAAGQKTGFYLDQKQNRTFLRPYFTGKNVLDLYCYSGAFSMAAAKGGAVRVLGVDSSADAVELARQNARLNAAEGLCRFEKGDAEKVLSEIESSDKEGRPDFILMDPPNLAPNKKGLPKALKTYSRLNALALRCLIREGFLATSSCSHHLDREGFVGMLKDAARRAGKQVRLVELRGQSADHPVLLSMPETEYLHFALLQVL